MAFKSEDLQLFFYEAIAEASSRLHLKIEQWTEFYLVNLLIRQVNQPADYSTPIVLQLGQALESKDSHERFMRLRRAGDAALFLTGFFAEHVSRKGITRHYVVQLGERAYQSAAPLSPDGLTHVYLNLSDGFNDYVRILDEVRELTDLKTPQDIVRLYDRWSKTGAASALRRLREAGVFPSKGSTKS